MSLCVAQASSIRAFNGNTENFDFLLIGMTEDINESVSSVEDLDVNLWPKFTCLREDSFRILLLLKGFTFLFLK